MDCGGKISCSPPRAWHKHDVAAGKAFVAHQTFDEHDALAVRRDVRFSDLPFGFVDLAHVPGWGINPVETGNPPIVVAGAVRGSADPAGCIRKPVIFIDVDIAGRDLGEFVRGEIDRGEALLIDFRTDNSGKGVMG